MVGSSGSLEVCLYSMSIIAMVEGNVTSLITLVPTTAGVSEVLRF